MLLMKSNKFYIFGYESCQPKTSLLMVHVYMVNPRNKYLKKKKHFPWVHDWIGSSPKKTHMKQQTELPRNKKYARLNCKAIILLSAKYY